MQNSILQAQILRLKKEKNAIILAHYYQEEPIQEVADFIGDSLGLSREAARTQADIIVFAGVHFMAETAKILNPSRKVLLPDLNAGCSLADSCPPGAFARFIAQYPDHTVISYINCSARVKAMSHIICTSANALSIVKSLPKEEKIIFAPDRNLGRYVQRASGRDLVLWDGACEVHEAFSVEKLAALRRKFPNAKLVAHPESEQVVLDGADFIGSTTAMIGFIKKDPSAAFIIATEAGILRQMRIEAPAKQLIPAPAKQDNSCACSECRFMKLNTLEKLRDCLLNGSNEILLNEDLRQKALIPLERMLAFGSKPVSTNA